VKGNPFDDFVNSFIRITGIPALVNGVGAVINGGNVLDVVKGTINQLANDSVVGQIAHGISGQPAKILSAEQVSEAVQMKEATPSLTPDIPDTLYVLIGKALFTMAQWVAIYWLYTRFIAAKKSSTSPPNEYTPIVDQEV
jgi:hypothetical protein